MPFEETCPVEERIALLRDYETGVFTVSELCRRFGISRETFYVWKRRRESGEERWFEERSHAVAGCPHATAGRVAARIIATRRRFAHFGPKKIKAWLEREAPEVAWPAASTIGDILKREGLVEPKRRRRRAIGQGEMVTPATAANAEWAIDFKGWFRTRDGSRCDPLTITDAASRYLIELRIVEPNYAGVRDVLERVFAEVGMPAAIRSDNGAPFGSTAQARHRAALHPSGEPTRQWPARAHASHAEGADLQARRSDRERAAGPLRPLPLALQRGEAA